TRIVTFGDVENGLLQDAEHAGQIMAARIGAVTEGSSPGELLNTSHRVAVVLDHEFAWRTSPTGYWTGWAPFEAPFTAADKFKEGEALTLSVCIGMVTMMDTFLLTDAGLERLSCDFEGPMRKFRVGEQILELPDLIRR
ncbi:MAG: hypothetical protein ACJ8LM_16210, partial [Candidatus Udaeobacter sp.]